MSKKNRYPTAKNKAKEGTEKAQPKRSRSKTVARSDLDFGSRNYAALGAALVSILLGFFVLSRGSITLAPILLVLGYCVLVPYGLATGRSKKASVSGE
ncbi:MAG: hypothetical protein HKN21_05560 [Candidatus Eisenbacteria bacterium]|uniref:DUF3098 domain-containing protein n=1 Tax=Eiseniibacteriota bacterium TaxID=2212470 RepID=A0A7Y2E6S8_UNCEI|nr:hypothetical protein [Candidatus Eisenbacteria bacterium]